MAEVKFKVARAHWGDKIIEGETKRHRFRKNSNRVADPLDVAELVKRKILIEPSDGDQTDPAVDTPGEPAE